MPSPKPTAYSYPRLSFSDASKARDEIVLAERWCDEKGVDLAAGLQMEKPTGVDSRGGDAVLILNAFVAAVDAGKVKPGDFLLIESFGGLTDEGRDVVGRLCQEIVERGVSIVTLPDATIHTARLLLVPARIKRMPTWCKRRYKEEIYHLNFERGTILLRIYVDTLAGVAASEIAANLNASGEAPWGNDKIWTKNSVELALEDTALVGRALVSRYPKVSSKPSVAARAIIEGFFPPIIPIEAFNRVKELRHQLRNPNPIAKENKVDNLFADIARCVHSGKRVVYLDKGANFTFLKPALSLYDIAPDNKRGWRYDEFEQLFLKAISRLDWRVIQDHGHRYLEVAKEAVGKANTSLDELRKETAALHANTRLGEKEWSEAFDVNKDKWDRLVPLAAETRAERRRAENSQISESDFRRLLSLVPQAADAATRPALRAAIRALVLRIDIDFMPTIIPFWSRSLTIVFANGARQIVVEGTECEPILDRKDQQPDPTKGFAAEIERREEELYALASGVENYD